jgi:hypothetical protein
LRSTVSTSERRCDLLHLVSDIKTGLLSRCEPSRHQITVALLDHIAEVNADAELNSQRPVLRSTCRSALRWRNARIDDASKLNEDAISGALNYAPVMNGDGRVNQIAAERA